MLQFSQFMLAYARALGVTYYAYMPAYIIRQPLAIGRPRHSYMYLWQSRRTKSL